MENNARLAYLIQAHSDPQQLLRTVDALDEDADFFIHVDRKTPLEPFLVLDGRPNVFLVPDRERVKVYWGAVSQIEATLKLIRMCLERQRQLGAPYLKAVLISGACYPLRSNGNIRRFFEERPGVNFIRAMDVSAANAPKYDYCLRRWLFFNFGLGNPWLTRAVRWGLHQAARLLPLKPNYVRCGERKMPVYHGSQWWALDTAVLEYFMREEGLRRCFDRYFRFSLASDEKYFHTLFFNSPFASTAVAGGPEPFVPATCAFANLHVIDQSLQKWFAEEDFDALAASDKLFVRKVSSTHSSALLDRIDQTLRTRP